MAQSDPSFDLQSWIGAELLARTGMIRQNPLLIVEFSAWRAPMRHDLEALYPHAQCLSLWSDQGLSQEGRAAVRSCGYCLPLADRSVDLLIVSVCGYHDARFLAEIRRVLKPGKLCLMVELESTGLESMRNCAFECGIVLNWPKASGSELAAECQKSGFEWPVLDTERFAVDARSVQSWFQQMHQAGYMTASVQDLKVLMTHWQKYMSSNAAPLRPQLIFAHLVKHTHNRQHPHVVGVPSLLRP